MKVFLLLALAASGLWAQTFVQVQSNGNAGSSNTVALSPTAGNTLIVTSYSGNTGNSISCAGAACSFTNLYTDGDRANVWIAYAVPAGVTGVTVSGSGPIFTTAMEAAGVAAVDVSAPSTGTYANNLTLPSVTTASATDLLIGCFVHFSNFAASSPTNSFTLSANANPNHVAMTYRAVTSTGSYATALTWGGTDTIDGLMLALKGSGGGATPKQIGRMILQ